MLFEWHKVGWKSIFISKIDLPEKVNQGGENLWHLYAT